MGAKWRDEQYLPKRSLAYVQVKEIDKGYMARSQ